MFCIHRKQNYDVNKKNTKSNQNITTQMDSVREAGKFRTILPQVSILFIKIKNLIEPLPLISDTSVDGKKFPVF